jgi:hypothetical protein
MIEAMILLVCILLGVFCSFDIEANEKELNKKERVK